MSDKGSTAANSCYGFIPIDRQLILSGLLSIYIGCLYRNMAIRGPASAGF